MSLQNMLDPHTIQPESPPEGVSMRSPSGWQLMFAGPHVVLYISWIIFAVGIVYVVKDEMKGRSLEHMQISTNQRELVEQLEVQNWLLAMDPSRRPQLKRPPGADRYLLKID